MSDERGDAPGPDVPPPYPPPPPPQSPYGAYPGGYPPPQSPYGSYPGGYPPQQPPYGAGSGPSNGLGIAALVTAVVALVLVWSVIGGLILGVIAVILGFVARGRYKRGEATNGGVATSGIVLGAVAVVLSLVFIGIWATLGIRWFDEIGGRDYVDCLEQAGDDEAAQQQCEQTFEKRIEDEFGVTPTPTP